MVNGFLASNYVTFQADSPELVFGSFKTGITYHWLAQKFQFPHRVICHCFRPCTHEQYSSNGISLWVHAPYRAGKWLMQRNGFIIGLVLAPLLCVFSVYHLVEQALFVPSGLAIIFLLAYYVLYFRIGRQTNAAQLKETRYQ